MATAPRPGGTRKDAERQQAEQIRIGVKLDGETYILRPNDVTAHQVGLLRQETGKNLAGLFAELRSGADLDIWAALIWLVRIQRGEDVTLRQVSDLITFDSKLEFPDDSDLDDAESGDLGPEA